MSQGSPPVKPYGEIYVATSRRHYEVITRAAEIVGTTRSGFVREFMLNPFKVIESFVERVNVLESRVRELESKAREVDEILSEVAPVVKPFIAFNGVKYVLSVPGDWSRFFENFVALRGLEESFRRYVRDYLSGYNYIDRKVIESVSPTLYLERVDVRLNKVAHMLKFEKI